MFEIIVDSAANIPAELCKKYKIKVLSFVNLVNGKEMTCFEPDLTPEQERANVMRRQGLRMWTILIRMM